VAKVPRARELVVGERAQERDLYVSKGRVARLRCRRIGGHNLVSGLLGIAELDAFV